MTGYKQAFLIKFYTAETGVRFTSRKLHAFCLLLAACLLCDNFEGFVLRYLTGASDSCFATVGCPGGNGGGRINLEERVCSSVGIHPPLCDSNT